MRIVSTLPTATEIVYQLGLGKQLVGVSHECNYPSQASKKPRISETDIDYGKATSIEIDNHVTAKMHEHHSLYNLKEDLLMHLAPTYLITQKLCDVCAVTPNDLQRVIRTLSKKPELITLNPTSLKEILQDILRVGKVLKVEDRAQRLVGKLRRKIQEIREKTNGLLQPKILCLEWLDPPFASGHWVPEMVEIAGGVEVLGLKNKPSRKISWEDVKRMDPEIIVMMPCGFSIDKTLGELKGLARNPLWQSLKAVKEGEVYVVDGPSYFNQSGPRVIEVGIEILAKIIHPEIFGNPSKKEALRFAQLVTTQI